MSSIWCATALLSVRLRFMPAARVCAGPLPGSTNMLKPWQGIRVNWSSGRHRVHGKFNGWMLPFEGSSTIGLAAAWPAQDSDASGGKKTQRRVFQGLPRDDINPWRVRLESAGWLDWSKLYTVSCMEFKITYPPQYRTLSYTHQIFGSFWAFWGGSAELMQTLPGMYPFLPIALSMSIQQSQSMNLDLKHALDYRLDMTRLFNMSGW